MRQEGNFPPSLVIFKKMLADTAPTLRAARIVPAGRNLLRTRERLPHSKVIQFDKSGVSQLAFEDTEQFSVVHEQLSLPPAQLLFAAVDHFRQMPPNLLIGNGVAMYNRACPLDPVSNPTGEFRFIKTSTMGWCLTRRQRSAWQWSGR